MNFIDINYIHKFDEINLLKELNWNGSILVQNNEFNRELYENTKKLGESIDFNIYSAIKLSNLKNANELNRIVRKYRNKVDIIIINGNGEYTISRASLECHNVDILSNIENTQNNGLDHILAKLGYEHKVAIELNFNNLLNKQKYDKSKLLWSFRRNLTITKKYKTPVVVSSNAKNIYEIKSPMDFKCFLNTLTEDINYTNNILKTTNDIVNYRVNLKDKNVIKYGVKIIEINDNNNNNDN